MGVWDGPVILVVAVIAAYWMGVLVMVALARRWGAASAGFIPAEHLERLMWVAWAPLIVCWVVFPILAATQDNPPWALPSVADRPAFHLVPPGVFEHIGFLAVRWMAAVAAAGALALTIACWAKMGRNWRIGVVPDDRAELVTGGAYRWVRHPIYALSVLLVVCTAVVVPIWPMALVAGLHLVFMNLKARNEERHLERVFGEDYRQYMKRTGRFVPRWGRR